jgi:hypothetical protein
VWGAGAGEEEAVAPAWEGTLSTYGKEVLSRGRSEPVGDTAVR